MEKMFLVVVLLWALGCNSNLHGDPFKTVMLGDSVTLSCSGPVNTPLEEMLVQWKTRDQLVAQFSRGASSAGPGFENRVSLSGEGVAKGNFSLIISQAVYSDTDTYDCFLRNKLRNTWVLRVTASYLNDISVLRGASPSLPCFTLTNRQLPISRLRVQWRRGDQLVLDLSDGTIQRNAQFSNRTFLALQEARQGDLSLTIMDVQVSHTGLYTCFIDGNKTSVNSVRLHVSHAPDIHVVHYTGDTFSIHLPQDVNISFIPRESRSPEWLCSVMDGAARCRRDVYHRFSLIDDVFSIRRLKKQDEGTYTFMDDDGMQVIFLEVRDGLPTILYGVVMLLSVTLLLCWSSSLLRWCR